MSRPCPDPMGPMFFQNMQAHPLHFQQVQNPALKNGSYSKIRYSYNMATTYSQSFEEATRIYIHTIYIYTIDYILYGPYHTIPYIIMIDQLCIYDVKLVPYSFIYKFSLFFFVVGLCSDTGQLTLVDQNELAGA